jgi:DNA mismatch repair ATPase MutS
MTCDTDYSYCAFFFKIDNLIEVCLADISVGVFACANVLCSAEAVASVMSKFHPKEVVFVKEQRNILFEFVKASSNVNISFKPITGINSARDLMNQFYDDMLLTDLRSQLKEIDIFDCSSKSVNLSGAILESLDIFSQNPRKKTLWKQLNRTITASGRRLLTKWIMYPSCCRKIIEYRQRKVCTLMNDSKLLGKSHLL